MANARGRPSRRKALERLKKPGGGTHPGLWLDKYLWSSEKEDTKSKPSLVEEVVEAAGKTKIRDAYRAFFDRHQAALLQRPGLTYTATGKTQGRLSVGLGANAVLETSILLHRTYGVPYIPGSALKGLASSYAAKRLKYQSHWRRSFDGGKTDRGTLQRLIFGDTEESGLVIFFDALPNPDDFQLDRDVITVHHPKYYQGGEAPPADWDAPTPVPFITARGTFHFFLGLVPLPKEELENGRQILDLAARLLKQALEEEGVGAKTTLGYGRFVFEKGFEAPKPPPPKRSEAYAKLASAVRALNWNSPPHQIAQSLNPFAELGEDEKQAFVEEHRKALEKVLGKPGAPNSKALRPAKNNPGLGELARRLGLLR